jgi:hypothetical protein
MAGDIGEFGEGADAWVSDVGMGLPGVLTGLGLPGEGYMALSHAGVFHMCGGVLGRGAGEDGGRRGGGGGDKG